MPQCRRCARLLSGNLESLLTGTTPDPDTAARLRLTQALQRAKLAIAWERIWPHLARFLSVSGLFLAVSWAGLWLALPFVALWYVLAMAIPAVVAYNRLADQVSRLELRFDTFIEEFSTILQRHGSPRPQA